MLDCPLPRTLHYVDDSQPGLTRRAGATVSSIWMPMANGYVTATPSRASPHW